MACANQPHPSGPITKTDALTLSTHELAERVMGPIGDIINEVERPTFSGIVGSEKVLSGLTFATKPKPSGNPGLCEARIIFVSFERLVESDQPGSQNTRVKPSSIYSRDVFKVVGDTSKLKDGWTDAYKRKLEADCKNSGRVTPTEDGDQGQTSFFSVQGPAQMGLPNNAWIAAHIFQLAFKSAASHTQPAPVCTDIRSLGPSNASASCKDSVELLSNLSLNALKRASVERCTDKSFICVEGDFLHAGDSNTVWSWAIVVEIESIGPFHSSRQFGSIRKIEITPSETAID